MNEFIFTLERINGVDFFGVNDSKLNLLKKAFPRLKIISRGRKLKVAGAEDDILIFKKKMEAMLVFLDTYGRLNDSDLENILFNNLDKDESLMQSSNDVIVYGANGKIVRARTKNQRVIVEKSETNDILFAIGPAGTGKTYTAVALAVRALKDRSVKKIVLTRPAVEAGESLGFLPGDLKEKIDPYLRPLYDGLNDMIPADKLNLHMQNKVIEIAPLAFMRGRTLDNAFIILDEAQNCTDAQLKMFLTRLGPSAKCIITGDMSQVDLPPRQRSGLLTAMQILGNIEGISVVKLERGDVVRHRLVKHIIGAYEDLADKERAKAMEKKNAKKNNDQ